MKQEFRSLSIQQRGVSIAGEAGFTLIEIVLVIGLFAFILVVFLNIFGWSNESYLYQQAQVRVETSARQAMTEIRNTTLQAESVLASQVIGGMGYTSGQTALVLRLPAINSSNVAIPNTWDYVVFYGNANMLYERIEPDPASSRHAIIKLLSDSVSSLIFEYDNVDFAQVAMVDVELTTELTVRSKTAHARLGQRLYMRN